MKYLALLLIFGFGLSGFGQTIKSLGYNTTNGQVVANTGTNVLTFTNDVKFGGGELSIETQNISGGNVSFSFEDGLFGGPLVIASNSTITFLGNVAATTRTNLGLGPFNGDNGFAVLTDESNNAVISTEDSKAGFHAAFHFFSDPTNAAISRANLGFSTNLNTLWTATNSSNARSAIGLGTNDTITLAYGSEAYIAQDGGWLYVDNLAPVYIAVGDGRIDWGGGSPNGLRFSLGTNEAFRIINDGLHPAIADGKFRGSLNGSVNLGSGQAVTFKTGSQGIVFEDANAKNLTLANIGLGSTNAVTFGSVGFGTNATGAAITRTNLGLGWSALTNTNVTNFRSSIGLSDTDEVSFSRLFLTKSNSRIALGTENSYLSQSNFTFWFSHFGSDVFSIGGTNITLLTQGGALAFGDGNTTGAAISRTNLGLGGGITTNRTFVSYNGTNYTTNTVTISNGVITAWTQ